MSANEARTALQDGDLDRCRSLLFAHLRAKPEDAKARVFLFQFLAVTGDWDRAAKQLELCAEQDAEAIPMAAIFSAAIDAERRRAKVFAGEAAPTLFGEPAEWIAQLVHALKLDAEGRGEAAAELRERAMAAAPAGGGAIDDERFEWICDADARLGPVLEVVVNNDYHWLPMENVARLKFAAPADLRDLVWMEAELLLANGGEMAVVVPTRYPGSETSDDPQIRLSRRTDWREIGPGMFAGAGQRMFATDASDFSMMDVREISLDPAP